MARKGPVPKRSSQRHGHRSKADKAAVDRTAMAGAVEVPPPPDEWHPIARRWYESLRESGQHRWYEASDWAAAQYVGELMTRHLRNASGEERATPSAQMFASIWSAMSELLTTEGSRRRAQLEIERNTGAAEDGEGEVARLDEFRRRASS